MSAMSHRASKSTKQWMGESNGSVCQTDLCRFALFTGLESRSLDRLSCVARRRRYGAGQTIELEGAPSPPVSFVVSGAKRVFKTKADGRQQTFARLGPGAAFYVPPAFTLDNSAPCVIN